MSASAREQFDLDQLGGILAGTEEDGVVQGVPDHPDHVRIAQKEQNNRVG
jgi:hypothetical protein